jgi:hypothetical protein
MKKPIPALIPFLVFISMVFIGILIYVYVQTKKANPQMIETAQALCSTRSRGARGESAEDNQIGSIGRRPIGAAFPPRPLRVLRGSALKTMPAAPPA